MRTYPSYRPCNTGKAAMAGFYHGQMWVVGVLKASLHLSLPLPWERNSPAGRLASVHAAQKGSAG